MTEKAENKEEALPDLDDLLQCPVCYEIPTAQIFQCNEGHHVCGRCKMRLDVCPVCRAFFFGTRNYAMEELISNIKKLRAFKLGGKVTTGSPPSEATSEAKESSSEDNESSQENVNNEEDEEEDNSSRTSSRPPAMCKGLFRCLCCKNNPERLPLGRLLNHLRYYHSPELIEGRSENGGYIQAWQFPTAPGRVVTAVRVHDMGIFFLVIEISPESVHAWMSMAAAPWVTHDFTYTFTLSGNDREAIFTDSVWSVRSCEGTLKKRGHCLSVLDADARALLTPSTMSGKLAVKRAGAGEAPRSAEPRAVLRVANRSRPSPDVTSELEPFLLDLQDDVARLSRAFATLGREANALVRNEAEMRALYVHMTDDAARVPAVAPAPASAPAPDGERHLSRGARRRMRQRLREAFRESQAVEPEPTRAVVARPPALAPRPAPAVAPRPSPAVAPRPSPAVAPRPAPAVAPRPAPAIAPRPSPAVAPRPAPTPTPAPRPPPGRFPAAPTPALPSRLVTIQNVTISPINPAVISARAPRSNGGHVVTSANPIRATGSNANPVQARANSNQSSTPVGRAGNVQVHRIGYLRVVSPTEAVPPVALPPLQSPAVGGPSQDRPSSGNARNKKKRRQRT